MKNLMTVEGLQQALHDGKVVAIEFTKSDGHRRAMRCTINVNEMPKDKVVRFKTKIPITGDVQRVFDLDFKVWRSFRYEEVTNFIEVR